MRTLIEGSGLAPFQEETWLVERAQKGDETSFSTLYRKYYNKVFSIAKGVLLNADEAEDATQEIFNLAWKHIRKFDNRSKFSTWLFRIAVNRSIQESRKNRNLKNQVPMTPEAENVAQPANEQSEDPVIAEALSRLSPQDRAIISLFYWDELSLAEVGESIGCSPNAAKTRLFRAREKFKDLYEGLTQ